MEETGRGGIRVYLVVDWIWIGGDREISHDSKAYCLGDKMDRGFGR